MAGDRNRFTVGNNAAKKYDLQTAREIFRMILDMIEEDPKIIYLNQPLNKLGYYPQLLKYLLNNHGEDEELVELSYKIESLLEERLVVSSLNGKVKEATAIFVMKARFHMHETQHIHHSSDPELSAPSKSLNLENASPEELEKLVEVMEKLNAKNNEEQGGQPTKEDMGT